MIKLQIPWWITILPNDKSARQFDVRRTCNQQDTWKNRERPPPSVCEIQMYVKLCQFLSLSPFQPSTQLPELSAALSTDERYELGRLNIL